MSKQKITQTLPTVLAFERKISPSDALMFSCDFERSNEAEPISIMKRNVLSTQSAYGIDDAKKSKPNPVSEGSDDAILPFHHDSLKLVFTLRVLGDIDRPSSCNLPSFSEKMTGIISLARKNNLFSELALRYAYNIANARFLFRNRVGAEKIEVCVKTQTHTLSFNAYDYSMADFEQNKECPKLKELASEIENGFTDSATFFEISTVVKIGQGQRVYPSQEMITERAKMLFQLNQQAAMHSEKIGNALRTIDTWYVPSKKSTPIAVEPYGAAVHLGEVHRKNTNDLYTLMIEWANGNSISHEEQLFVLANFIRGGIFGGAE